MNNFNSAPRPDDVLGEGFEAKWQTRHDELAKRAQSVDLVAYLTPEEKARMEEVLTQIGIADTDEFLRIQIIRHGDVAASTEDPITVAAFTNQVVASLRDWQFS
jgi:hypothetical protein